MTPIESSMIRQAKCLPCYLSQVRDFGLCLSTPLPPELSTIFEGAMSFLRSVTGTAEAHSTVEDICSVSLGCFVIALGIGILKAGGVVTGGTSGLALLTGYLWEVPFSDAFFLINMPFYAFALWKFGWKFSITTACCVFMVSFFTRVHVEFLPLPSINPLYASLLGNSLFAFGFIAIFRHKASLGGFNIIALFLQQRFRIPAGVTQLGTDTVILAISLCTMSLSAILASIAGALLLNIILTFNFRSDRYLPR